VLTVGRVRDGEEGFTLVELLVAMTAGLIVIFACLSLLSVSSAQQQRTDARTETLTNVQVGMARLTRELHEAEVFNFLNTQVVDINAWVRSNGAGSMVRIRYDCSQLNECRRYQVAVGAALPATYTVLASGVSNVDVFVPEPDALKPDFINVKLRLDVAGFSQPLIVQDGVNLPNLDT
jgi:type II secretory pathway pseudopilin PulG